MNKAVSTPHTRDQIRIGRVGVLAALAALATVAAAAGCSKTELPTAPANIANAPLAKPDTTLVSAADTAVSQVSYLTRQHRLVFTYSGSSGQCGQLAEASTSRSGDNLTLTVRIGDAPGAQVCNGTGQLSTVALELSGKVGRVTDSSGKNLNITVFR